MSATVRNPNPDRPILKRAAAKALGLTRYFTGKPCPKGHIADRMVSSMACRPCAVEAKLRWEAIQTAPRRARAAQAKIERQTPEYQKALKDRERRTSQLYYQKNRERMKAYGAEWFAANRERKLAVGAEWHRNNQARVRDNHIEAAKRNPHIARAAKLRRRAREASAGGTVTADDLREIMARQNGKCAYCRVQLNGKFHADHVMPLCLGGSGDAKNIQATCALCNAKKSRSHPVDFAKKLGLLL